MLIQFVGITDLQICKNEKNMFRPFIFHIFPPPLISFAKIILFYSDHIVGPNVDMSLKSTHMNHQCQHLGQTAHAYYVNGYPYGQDEEWTSHSLHEWFLLMFHATILLFSTQPSNGCSNVHKICWLELSINISGNYLLDAKTSLRIHFKSIYKSFFSLCLTIQWMHKHP